MKAARKKTKKQAVQLPVHRGSGNYYKCIGRYLHKDGKPRPKIFYFDGNDFGAAVTKIGELKQRWQKLLDEGKSFWDEDPIYAAERSGVVAPQPKRPSGVITVSEGFGHYSDHLKRQYEGGQIKESHYTSQVYRMQFICRLPISEGRTFGSLPLPQANRIELEAVVLAICNRPEVTRHHYKGAAEKFAKAQAEVPKTKMTYAYARALKTTCKTSFEWLAEEKLWSVCSHWKAIWKRQIVVTDEELADTIDRQTDGEVDHFDLEELQKLWAATEGTLKPDFWRACILLSLNCGFANEEIASLKLPEVKGGSGCAFTIERYRGKTVKRAKQKAYGRWSLWEETAEYIFKASAGNPFLCTPEQQVSYSGPMLTTEAGKRLTENNAIGQGWRRLSAAAGVRYLPFKFMRKTAAHIMRNEIGYGPVEGKALADMLLSHSESGIIASYAGRDWDTLKVATKAMRKHLNKLFTKKPKAKPAVHRAVIKERPPMKIAV